MNFFIRFPEGKTKILTFNYDDGAIEDKRLVEIFDKYGMKGTFNLNTGLMGKGENINGRLTYKQAYDLFADSPHEVALHGHMHPRLDAMPPELAARDILENKKRLEDLFMRPVRGIAYPFGGFNEHTLTALKNYGIDYGRTVDQTQRFDIPLNNEQWLALHPTCHHNHRRLMEMGEILINEDIKWYPEMYAIWGHSSDFTIDDNWNIIEDFCQLMCNKSDIWYATYIEIYDYFDAYNHLIFSAAQTRVYNPSAIPVWFEIDGKIYRVNPDETLELK